MTKSKSPTASSTMQGSEAANNDVHVLPSKNCLTCDAEGCEKTNPRMRCSRCRTVFYCDRECATAHWRTHKPDCRAVEDMRSMMVGINPEKTRNSSSFQMADVAANKGDEDFGCCSICLEEPIRNPVVLRECRHAFCFSCLTKYQRLYGRQSDTTPCPNCRRDVPKFRDALVAQGAFYIASAQQRNKRKANERNMDGEVEDEIIQEHCNAAFEIAAKLESNAEMLESGADQLSDQMQANLFYMEVAILRKDYQQALDRCKQNSEILALGAMRSAQIDQIAQELYGNDENDHDGEQRLMERIQSLSDQGLAKDSELIEMRLKLASIQMLMENWTGAQLTYRKLFEDFPDQESMTPPQHRQVFMGSSQCMYEQGHYDRAIMAGMAALEMNRHFPQSHRYVALAQKAKGEWDEAIRVAAQAVHYETPWDEENIAECHQLWEELLREKEDQTDTSET